MQIGFASYSYKLLGKRVKKLLPHFEELQTQMKKGGVKIVFPAYISLMLFMAIISFASTTLITFLLSPIIFHVVFLSLQNLAFSFMLGSLAFIMTFILMYMYPGMKSTNRKIPIEVNLPYISSFLTLLSSSNVPPRTIFRSIAKIDTLKEVRQEFSTIVRDVDVFGQDLLTSIVENAKNSPSNKLREVLNGYVTTIRTGGNPTDYLKISTENIMKERMVKLDLMLESLSAMAEIYIMVLVAMPLLFVTLFATLGMISGGGVGFFNPRMMLYLLTYAGIPVLATIMIVTISTFTVR